MKVGKEEKKQVKLAQDWNLKNKVGIAVIVTKDDLSKVQTKTRSKAFMLGKNGDYPGHTAVIQLDGISGSYALERVRPEKLG
jgi:hypothetical protein